MTTHRLAPDGTLRMTAGSLGVQVHDVVTGELAFAAPEAQGISSAQFSADGAYLAAGSAKALWVWELASGRRLLHAKRPASTVIAFSNDGTLLATEGREIVVWQVPAAKRLAVLEEPEETYWAAARYPSRLGAFSPDNAALVVVKNHFTGRFGHVDQDFYSDAILSWSLDSGAHHAVLGFEEERSWHSDNRVELVGFDAEGPTLLATRSGHGGAAGPQLELRRVPDLALLAAHPLAALPPSAKQLLDRVAAAAPPSLRQG